jgi:hypothetical protein
MQEARADHHPPRRNALASATFWKTGADGCDRFPLGGIVYPDRLGI